MNALVTEYRIKGIIFQVVLGDISDACTDGVVCPGNSLGLMRGGASQALRIKGGTEIEQEAKKHAPIRIGQALAINGHKLHSKMLIYAPAIVKPVDCANRRSVFSAAKAATKCALRNDLHTISFPILGAGTGQLDFETSCTEMLSGIFSEDFNSMQIRTIALYVRREDRFETLKKILSEKSDT